MDKSHNKMQLTHKRQVSNSREPLIIFRISDYTTDVSYAEKKRNEGYIINAIIFK